MQVPETDKQPQSAFTVDPIGFENRINYAAAYHLFAQKLNDIHGDGRTRDAISYYNEMVVPFFGGVFDATFRRNCQEITESVTDFRTAYMLHRVELGRLMSRSGIAPKPDIRIRYKGTWKVPETLEDLSFDGKDVTQKEDDK